MLVVVAAVSRVLGTAVALAAAALLSYVAVPALLVAGRAAAPTGERRRARTWVVRPRAPAAASPTPVRRTSTSRSRPETRPRPSSRCRAPRARKAHPSRGVSESRSEPAGRGAACGAGSLQVACTPRRTPRGAKRVRRRWHRASVSRSVPVAPRTWTLIWEAGRGRVADLVEHATVPTERRLSRPRDDEGTLSVGCQPKASRNRSRARSDPSTPGSEANASIATTPS